MSGRSLDDRVKIAGKRAKLATLKRVEQVEKNRQKVAKFAYDAIRTHPQRRAIEVVNKKSEDEILKKQDRLKAISMARDMARNFPIVKSIIARQVDCIIGPGSRLKIKTDDAEGDKEVERWFNKIWAQAAVCDGRKRMDLWSYQRAVFMEWFTTGESIVWFDESGGQMFGFEADQLTTPSDWKALKTPEGAAIQFILDGIVTDRLGAPTDYIISPTGDQHKPLKDLMSFKASVIIHVAEFFRFRQAHGVSRILHSGGQLVDQQDYIRADLLSSKAAAKFAMWVQKKDALEFEGARTGNDIDVEGTGDETPTGSTSVALTEASSYNRLEQLTGGAMEYLEPGESIGVIKPERPNQAFADYVNATTRIIGAGNSLPLEMTLLDFSKTNYSSARAAILISWLSMAATASWFDINFNIPVAMRALKWGEANDNLTLPKGWEKGMKFTHPKMPEIDRLKAVNAQNGALAAGTTTYSEENEDWEQTFEQMKREQDKAAELGLTLTLPQLQDTKDAEENDNETNQAD